LRNDVAVQVATNVDKVSQIYHGRSVNIRLTLIGRAARPTDNPGHGIPKPKFKGFMADSAQANWNIVRVIYDSGDATIPMKDQERTCLFHWAQSLEKHTKADIRADFQHQQQQLYRQYKIAASASESETRYRAILAWWLSSEATTE
jgi:hypothetical protein